MFAKKICKEGFRWKLGDFLKVRHLSIQRLVYSEYGDPMKVVRLENAEVSSENLDRSEVLIQYMASPINPADINMIQGVYPIKPKLPAVGGNEGVARVEKVGSGVNGLKTGDWVLPVGAGMGTWQTSAVVSETKLFQISNDTPLGIAATLLVNPPTAYRMLKDFQDMKEGDYFVQNGANSGVGKAAIQIGKVLGLISVNIVRNRDNIRQLKAELEKLGADFVLTEEEVKGGKLKEISEEMGGKKPKLALNCVGGKSAMYLATGLGRGGKMVTYGGMSRMPLQVPTGPLIFKQIELHGFWMSHWYSFVEENKEKRKEMMTFLENMIRSGNLTQPSCDFVSLTEFSKALGNAVKGSVKKQILIFQ